MKQGKQRTKRIFSVLLTLTMAFVSFPATFSFDAAAALATSGITGDCTWTLDGTVLTISGNGAMADYSYSERAPWSIDITEVVIGSGVTNLGNFAFSGRRSLTSITIPTSVTNIGSSAFDGCTGLTSITIPDGVTSIGKYAFRNCLSLTSITIPDSVTSIGDYAFSGCRSLTSVTIPTSLTSIGSSAFSDCKSLTSITIPTSVTSIGRAAFGGCKSLTSVTIPDSVTNIGISAFDGCRSLTSITIPTSVTSIGSSAFSHCDKLKRVDISSIKMWCGIAFGGAYANPLCNGADLYLNNKKVENLTIPDSVTSIGDYAFEDCRSLTSVTIPTSVTSIGSYAFSYCDKLKRVDISSIKMWCGVAFGGYKANPLCNGADLYLNNKKVENLTIPDSVTSIGDYAFEDCRSLTSVTIPTSVTSIGSSAFSECTSLTSITTPDSVTSIGNAAFAGCTSLTSITIPNSVTSIRDFAFGRCTSLTGITIPDSVTSIDISAFSYCRSLTSVTIPTSVTSIGRYAFSECTSLTSVTIPTSVTSIGGYAFEECKNLTIRTPENSAAHKYAKSEGINYYLTSVTTQPSVPTVDGSQKADESSVTVTLRAVAGYEYRCNDGAWQKSPVFSGLPFGGLCRFYQRLAESEKSVAGPVGEALVVKLKSKCTAVPDAPQIVSKKFNRILLKEQPGYEYSMDGKAWQPTGLFTGLTADTEYTFYQRIAENDRYFSSSASQGLTIRTNEQSLYTPGDLDGDEEITEADAIYLLMASYFPEQYPLDQSCDYDGDGEITEADAIYLLMASYFPEQYPL